jgi:hypothetical protein
MHILRRKALTLEGDERFAFVAFKKKRGGIFLPSLCVALTSRLTPDVSVD